MLLFHHYSPLQLEIADWSWNHLMIGRKEKKKNILIKFILPISPSSSSSVLRGGNWKHPANASQKNPQKKRM